ncbi:hemolysin-type calcium-binding repeat 2 copies family protein [Asticcacaulis biprosthecium C19]|uniref:Hemolysin-type calcium-binding repeat 2 copies family protein n=1 Tax=Asticcacaulis biprosthecium C19 TaxID=715226 RepID=F4QM37_9CAUL|nr:M10 family metallopeptidase C-terminal domain-containing protein [Asticcacaulis biprosthecium]EGF93609.1 hemolysin-type calcium-binding repeat 2 copies family protein [Asticcacaulis biprosthecium C19]
MRVRFGLDFEGAGAASGILQSGSSVGKVLAVAVPAPVLAGLDAPGFEFGARGPVVSGAVSSLNGGASVGPASELHSAPANELSGAPEGDSSSTLTSGYVFCSCGLCAGGTNGTGGRFTAEEVAAADAGRGVGKGSGAGTSELLTDYHFDAVDNRYEFTGNQDIDAVLFGSRWTLSTITFSFPTSGAQYATPYYDPGYLTSHVAFNAAQQTAGEYAMLTLMRGYVSTFVNEIAPSLATPATIRMSQTTDASLGSAEGNFPGSDSWDGDIWFGMTGQPFYLTPQIGNWGQATIMHEIGHAMGLKHGHQDYTGFDLTVGGYLDGPGPRFGTRALPASHDSWAYSIMTYRSDPGNNPGGNPSFQGDQFNQPQTFMQNDIAALQYMYGADFTSPEAHPTDTVYTFNSITGRMSINGVGQETPTFDAVNNVGKIFRTIWDGGGVDTYDFDNYTTNQTIDLTPGGWSTMNSLQLADLRPLSATYVAAPGNIANALLYNGDLRSLIENANGGSGNDNIIGNDVNNVIHGNGGNDTVFGDDGNDLLYGEAGNDTLDGWIGNDSVYGGDGNDFMYGYDGNDFLIASTGLDTLRGESGNDYLSGGTGNDSMVGDTGNDTYVLEEAGDIVVEAASEGTDLVYAYFSYTLLANFENLTLLGTGNFDGTGNSAANLIYGNSFNNVLLGGGGGADTIFGQGGDDYIWNTNFANHSLNGGSGNDTVGGGFQYGGTWDGSTGVDMVDMTLHNFVATYNLVTGTYTTGGGTQNILNFENVNAGDQNDTINGSDAVNALYGNGGNDSINGLGGHDALYGGAGIDTLNGGTGNDTLLGGAGADIVNGQDGNDVITSSGDSGTYDGGTGNDTAFAGIGNETMIGGSGTDLLDTTSWSLAYTINLATGLTNFVGESFTGFENLTTGAGNDSLTGTFGVNVINGGAGNDTIDGGFGYDSLDGGAGIDTYDISGFTNLTGATINLATGLYTDGSGSETILNFENVLGAGGDQSYFGTNGANFIDGGDGNDLIDSGGGNDTVQGGAGNDTIGTTTFSSRSYLGQGGDDVISGGFNYGDTWDGGAGVDTADLTLHDFTATVDLLAGTYTTVNGTLNILNFENFNAGNQNDTIIGTSEANVINGGGGNDDIDGYSGNDTVDGGAGDDFIHSSSAGIKVYNGGAGNDTVGGNFGYNSSFDGGTGVDLLDMSFVFSTLLPVTFDMNTGAWVDGIGPFSAVNFENYIGFSDAESITGTSGANSIEGGDGDDTLVGGAGSDTLNGGAGNDSINAGALSDGTDTVNGNGGDDTIVSSGQGTYNGGLGDDYIYAGLTGAGAEVIDGGDGIDTLNTTLWGGDYLVDLTTGLTDTATEDFDNFENIISGSGNDTITGTAGANSIDGGAGADVLTGGAGDDTYIVDNTADDVNESSGGGNDLVRASVSYSLAGMVVETLTLMGVADINATGNGNGNTLNGNSGNNVLDGAAGADTMLGGLGNDSYYVNVAGDVVTEVAGEGNDTIFTALTYSLAGKQVENLTLEGAAAVNGTGNGLANVLKGNSAANTLDGGSGHDRVDGGLGADNLIGGTGNDTYVVDNAGDTVTEGAGAGGDLVESSVTYGLSLNVENLTLTGAAVINGSGNDLNNVLTGNSANNVLAGGLGNDTYYVQNTGDNVTEVGGAGIDLIYSTVSYSLAGRYAETITLTGAANINATGNSLGNTLNGNDGNNTINGKGGNDALTGGLGADIFLFEAASGSDTIGDFSAAQSDLININAYTGGVVNNALVVQVGANVVINLGGGNIITILTALEANVEAQIAW